MKTERAKTDFISITLQDEIVYVDFLSNDLSLSEAKEVVRLRLELIGNNSYPILVDGRKVSKLSKECRDYFGQPDALKGVKAGAILMDSTFGKFLGNFFLKVTYRSKKLPTMLFTDKEEALKWLSQYK